MAGRAILSALRLHSRVTSPRLALPPRCMSSSDAPPPKVAARREATAALRRLNVEAMAAESAAITAHLHATGLVAAASRLAIYVHCPRLREVDTTTVLLEALKRPDARVYAPRVLDKDANMHFLAITTLEELEEVPPFGIREPPMHDAAGAPREDVAEMDAPLDVVVMPGLAFDASGRRLGRGGGYYDKFIAGCEGRAAAHGWAPPLLVALAFRAQLVVDVPCDAHDRPVDLLVTPDGVRACSQRGREAERRAAAGGDSYAP